ncbi:type II toxin-antitoxin system HicA family toxin [Desulfofundulus sp. TPOSR]|uniref:type II toxin-antitoxin system HicA family toxin n=1 Tax=Desulfofundulus sp. TPOSR TaxID=2714340 RepID=UPI00140A2065|nr:type II toxin-antitoxin system HicA family toxin [Desulfofundulus sp. TPOSR]
MPKSVPSLKVKELIRLLESRGCKYYREGKGDHRLYVRYLKGRKIVVPIDMGAGEFSPVVVLRILRQFHFSDEEIDSVFKGW